MRISRLEGRRIALWGWGREGRAAHAGSQHREGINAIDALARALPGIAALTSADEDRTVNIGRVDGGTVVVRPTRTYT